jgi:hypothetical protein
MESMIEGPLFDELRTQQQLGYSVSSWRDRKGPHGQLHFMVQVTHDSGKFTASEVDGRIEQFLTGFSSTLKEMAVDDFDEHLQSMLETFRTPFQNLDETASDFWYEIACAAGVPRLAMLTPWELWGGVALAKVTQEMVADIFDQSICPGGADVRSIRVWTIGNAE